MCHNARLSRFAPPKSDWFGLLPWPNLSLCSFDRGPNPFRQDPFTDTSKIAFEFTGHIDVQVNRLNVTGYHHLPGRGVRQPVGTYNRH